MRDKDGVPIRCSSERWSHIEFAHPEVRAKRSLIASVLERPQAILDGGRGALLAVDRVGDRTWMVVCYRIVDRNEGFIITAFVTTDIGRLRRRRETLWKRPA